jgi:hypothetical protein
MEDLPWGMSRTRERTLLAISSPAAYSPASRSLRSTDRQFLWDNDHPTTGGMPNVYDQYSPGVCRQRQHLCIRVRLCSAASDEKLKEPTSQFF